MSWMLSCRKADVAKTSRILMTQVSTSDFAAATQFPKGKAVGEDRCEKYVRKLRSGG